ACSPRRHPSRAGRRRHHRGHPPRGRGWGAGRADRARLCGRPRRSGVHRMEQRLAGRRPRPGRRAGRQTHRPGGGPARPAALRGPRRRCPGRRPVARAGDRAGSAAARPGRQRLGLQRRPEAHRGVRRPLRDRFRCLAGRCGGGGPRDTDRAVVAGHRRGCARGGRPPGQRRARPRGRPGDRCARPAAPPRRHRLGGHGGAAAGRRLAGAGAGARRSVDRGRLGVPCPGRSDRGRRRARGDGAVPPAGVPGGHAPDRPRRGAARRGRRLTGL
ncbi:MAG: Similar to 1,4-dihydroxy-2-naphthoate octaprenyltransferase, partial [uncultured Blastococcus sp.]